MRGNVRMFTGNIINGGAGESKGKFNLSSIHL